MKNIIKYTLLILISLSLVACGTGKSNNDGKVVLGVNFDLSGEGAQYGEAELKGVELAVELYNKNGGFNGEDVILQVADAKSVPEEAYRAQTKLAEDGVFAIVGATVSATSALAVKASSEMEVPTVSPSATADSVTNDGAAGYPYGYRVCYSDSFQAVTMAKFTANKGFKKVAIVADKSSEYAQGLTDQYLENVNELGVEVVDIQYFSKDDVDFSVLLTNIKGNKDIEALFIPGYYGTVGPLLKQAHELGLDLPILGVDGYESDEFVKLAGAEALNNVFYSNHYSTVIKTDAHDDFVAAFEAKFGSKPNGFSALAFDATNLVLDALDRAGEADPKKVNEAIRSTKDFEAVTGVITIDELHNAQKATFVVELKDGVEVSAEIVEP